MTAEERVELNHFETFVGPFVYLCVLEYFLADETRTGTKYKCKHSRMRKSFRETGRTLGNRQHEMQLIGWVCKVGVTEQL